MRATVNYATEKAAVRFDADAVAPGQLLAAVEAAGYSAALPGTATDDEPDPLLARLRVSALLTLPVLLLSMAPVFFTSLPVMVTLARSALMSPLFTAVPA